MKWNRDWIRRTLLIALFGAAIAMACSGGTQPEPKPTPTPAAVPQDERISREKAYDKDIQSLRKLAEGGDDYAAEQMRNLIGMHQSEWAIEDALLNAGFERCLVIAQNGSITVMIEQEKMTEENSARILALCMAHADVGAQNVRIMAY